LHVKIADASNLGVYFLARGQKKIVGGANFTRINNWVYTFMTIYVKSTVFSV